MKMISQQLLICIWFLISNVVLFRSNNNSVLSSVEAWMIIHQKETRTIKTSSSLCTDGTSFISTSSSGIMNQLQRRQRRQRRGRSLSPRLMMNLDAGAFGSNNNNIDIDLLSPEVVNTIAEGISIPIPVTKLLEDTTQQVLQLPNNPEEESIVLNDMAHVLFDIVSLLNPETIILRLSVVVGNFLSMASDYIPDHVIRNDELAFNIPVLITSLFLLGRSATPIVKSTLIFPTNLTSLDNTVYNQFFEPASVSIQQYKSMKATTGCFTWVSYEPGTILIDENENHANNDDDNDDDSDTSHYLYWMLDGKVEFSFKGKTSYQIKRTNGAYIDDPNSMGLLGDMRFLYNLDRKAKKKKKKKKKETNNSDAHNQSNLANVTTTTTSYPMSTIKVIGSKNATMLRIDTNILYDLMDHDAKLESSIRSLLLKSLQRKVGALLLLSSNNVYNDN